MSTEILNSIITVFKANITNNSYSILVSLLILLIGIIFSKIIRIVIKKFLNKLNIDKSISNYIAYSVSALFLLIIALISLSILGIPTSTLISIVAVLGVSIGVAFKTTLENLGSGFIILFFKPFKTGDFIESEGIEGIVIDMHIFSTTLKTFDNKTVVVPNSKLTNQSITNYTKQEKRRVDIKFKLPYGTDISFAKDLLREIFQTEEKVIKDEYSIIGIRNFKENGIEILATSWVKTEDYWSTFYSLTSRIEETFRKNDISMQTTQKIIYETKNEL